MGMLLCCEQIETDFQRKHSNMNPQALYSGLDCVCESF